MATIGLRDLYRAPITIGDDGVEEYGTPVKMAKAISAELSAVSYTHLDVYKRQT